MNKEIALVGTQSTEAQEWAIEFMRLFGNRKEDIDRDLMITWFANAIEGAKDSMRGVDLASGPDYSTVTVQSVKEFENKYLNNWDTNYEVVDTCGDCEDFGIQGCKTSRLEAKYGTASTPACSEFKIKGK